MILFYFFYECINCVLYILRTKINKTGGFWLEIWLYALCCISLCWRAEPWHHHSAPWGCWLQGWRGHSQEVWREEAAGRQARDWWQQHHADTRTGCAFDSMLHHTPTAPTAPSANQAASKLVNESDGVIPLWGCIKPTHVVKLKLWRWHVTTGLSSHN